MEMIEVKTADLIGPALDWAVAQVEGVNYRQDGIKCKTRIAPRKWHHYTEPNFSPSTDWSWGGPLIDEYAISIMKPLFDDGIWIAERINETGEFHSGEGRQVGGTALIAMCRSLVSVLVGDTVSVPKELMQ